MEGRVSLESWLEDKSQGKGKRGRRRSVVFVFPLGPWPHALEAGGPGNPMSGQGPEKCPLPTPALRGSLFITTVWLSAGPHVQCQG
jgi:hypothetical protein